MLKVAFVIAVALVATAARPEDGYRPAPPELMLGTARSVPPEVERVEETSRWHWTTGDYVREALVLGLIGMDWHQTLTFRAQGVPETNPVLGRYPSRGRVNVLIGSAMLLHVGVSLALPHGEWRTSWQVAVGGAEAATVMSNWRQGWKPY